MLLIIASNEAALEGEVLTMFNSHDDQVLFTKIDIPGFPNIYKLFLVLIMPYTMYRGMN